MVYLREPQGHRKHEPLAHDSGRALKSLAFSPNGSHLATASFDGSIVIWNTEDFSEHLRISGHSGVVNRIEFTPDGRFLISVSADTTIKVWNVFQAVPNSELRTARLVFHRPDAVHALTIRADGKTMAVGGRMGEVSLIGMTMEPDQLIDSALGYVTR